MEKPQSARFEPTQPEIIGILIRYLNRSTTNAIHNRLSSAVITGRHLSKLFELFEVNLTDFLLLVWILVTYITLDPESESVFENVDLVTSILENTLKRPNWNLKDIVQHDIKKYQILFLTFLWNCVKIPAIFANVKFVLITKLKNHVKNDFFDKFCCLIFDEMVISPQFRFRKTFRYLEQGLFRKSN